MKRSRKYIQKLLALVTAGALLAATAVTALAADGAVVNLSGRASPGQADTTLYEEYGSLSVSLSRRPDVLIGCASSNMGSDVSGYDEQLNTIHSFTPDSPYYQEGDETYSPKLVGYAAGNLKDMIATVKALAEAIAAVEEETGKTTRYGDPRAIAQGYEDYVYGTFAYVKEQLAEKGLEEKTVAIVTAINEDGTYSIGGSPNTDGTNEDTNTLRVYEYSAPVSKNLADTCGKTVTLEQLLSADVIITFNSKTIDEAAIRESFGETSYDGILITTTPNTLYGLTVSSVENAMGVGYVVGSMYSDVLDIDPVEMCAYFYQHFLHITDLDALATVVRTNFAGTILPAGVSATLSPSYSEEHITQRIAEGIAYLEANPEKFVGVEYELNGMGGLYTDVSESDPYYEAIKYVTRDELLVGNGDGTFAPETSVNRAMLAVILYNLAGKPAVSGSTPFTDLTEDWYKDAVTWCYETGVVNGTSAATFTPDAVATRETILTMLYRYAGSVGQDVSGAADLSAYSDAASVSSWAKQAVQWAVANELLSGVSGGRSLTPGAEVQRCIAAQFMMNYSSLPSAGSSESSGGDRDSGQSQGGDRDSGQSQGGAR